MSLRWRWALTLGGLAAAAIGVAIVGALLATGRELRSEVDQSLIGRVEQVTRLPVPDILGTFPGPRMGGRRPDRPIVGLDAVVQVLDLDGTVVFRYESEPRLPVEAADLDRASRGELVTRTVDVESGQYRMVTGPTRSGFVQLARDLEETNRVIAGLGGRLALIGATAVALAALAGWLLAGRTVRPIIELTESAERVATTQDLNPTVPVSRDDEVGRLARAFSTMLGALSSSREQQRRLVSDAGHELRTPITALRTNLEVLKRRPELTSDQRSDLVNGALAEVGELTALVGELVDLATDATSTGESTVTTSIGDVVDPVVQRARRRTGRPITVTGVGDAQVTVRRSQIERAISNLLDNADKWAPADTPIEISVDGTRLAVHDHGPGIPAADLPRVFDRFYRSDAARSMPGSGLGLAIVRHAVEAHGGTVHASSHPEGGADVGFTLPPA